jgi:hypothetical protein
MKRVKDKTILEKIPLIECDAFDEIDIAYNENGRWTTIGLVTLVRIKVIDANTVQIKYRQKHRRSLVEKAIVPSDITVQRTRKADSGCALTINTTPLENFPHSEVEDVINQLDCIDPTYTPPPRVQHERLSSLTSLLSGRSLTRRPV